MTAQAEIDVLKAQVRSLKYMFYAMACLIVTAIAVAATSMQGVPDVIQAKKFEVVNEESKAVGRFSSGTSGGLLNIFNNNGESVAGLASGTDGGGLVIFSNNERIIAGLAAHEDGGGLVIYNNQMKEIFRIPEKEAVGK